MSDKNIRLVRTSVVLEQFFGFLLFEQLLSKCDSSCQRHPILQTAFRQKLGGNWTIWFTAIARFQASVNKSLGWQWDIYYIKTSKKLDTEIQFLLWDSKMSWEILSLLCLFVMMKVQKGRTKCLFRPMNLLTLFVHTVSKRICLFTVGDSTKVCLIFLSSWWVWNALTCIYSSWTPFPGKNEVLFSLHCCTSLSVLFLSPAFCFETSVRSNVFSWSQTCHFSWQSHFGTVSPDLLLMSKWRRCERTGGDCTGRFPAQICEAELRSPKVMLTHRYSQSTAFQRVIYRTLGVATDLTWGGCTTTMGLTSSAREQTQELWKLSKVVKNWAAAKGRDGAPSHVSVLRRLQLMCSPLHGQVGEKLLQGIKGQLLFAAPIAAQVAGVGHSFCLLTLGRSCRQHQS